MRNSIETSKTGNCTNFDEALCESEGLLDFSWKRSQSMLDPVNPVEDRNLLMAEKLLIKNNLDCPNFLHDNVLYYVAGFLSDH